jgi:hypothetical protein
MSKLKALYNKSKSAKVGEECVCPSCYRPFIKSSYQQAFCKNMGKTICKDYYWNNVTPTKRNNTTRISPANQKFYVNHIEPCKNNQCDFDDDQSWDAHKSY